MKVSKLIKKTLEGNPEIDIFKFIFKNNLESGDLTNTKDNKLIGQYEHYIVIPKDEEKYSPKKKEFIKRINDLQDSLIPKNLKVFEQFDFLLDQPNAGFTGFMNFEETIGKRRELVKDTLYGGSAVKCLNSDTTKELVKKIGITIFPKKKWAENHFKENKNNGIYGAECAFYGDLK